MIIIYHHVVNNKYLQKSGIHTKSIVGSYMDRGEEYFVAILYVRYAQ